MPTPTLLTTTLLEETTGFYTFELVDDNGEGVDGESLTDLTVTLYDVDSNQVVNGRHNQNILNMNDGTVSTVVGPPLVTTVQLALRPQDTVIFNQQRLVEYRVLEFRWAWNQGQRMQAHAVQFGVESLAMFP